MKRTNGLAIGKSSGALLVALATMAACDPEDPSGGPEDPPPNGSTGGGDPGGPSDNTGGGDPGGPSDNTGGMAGSDPNCDADSCGDNSTCDDSSGSIECVCDEGFHDDDADGNCESDECSEVLGVSCEQFNEGYIKANDTWSTDWFGSSVAMSGDTFVVGAVGEDGEFSGVNPRQDGYAPNAGAVYVYVRDGETWRQQAYIKASNTKNLIPNGGLGDWQYFGASVALDGDTLVVGRPEENSATNEVNGEQFNVDAPASGAAYVFKRTGDTWEQEAYLKAENNVERGSFGASISLNGDTIAVSGGGATNIFVRDAGVWTQQAELPRSGGETCNVALEGDTLARSCNDSLRIFERVGTTWSEKVNFEVSGAHTPNLSLPSGGALALHGDTIAVGARPLDHSLVHVFTREGSTWSKVAVLRAPHEDIGDDFGYALAVHGNRIAVGAREEDSDAIGLSEDPGNNNSFNSGAVYLFQGAGANWEQIAYIKATNADPEDLFGSAVALSQDRLLVGAQKEGSDATGIDGDQLNNNMPHSGAAYVMRIAP